MAGAKWSLESPPGAGLAGIGPWQDEWGAPELVDFPAQTTVFRQGDPVRGVLVITNGAVKTVRHEANGVAIIANVRQAGWVLGAAPALHGRPYAVTAVAITLCQCVRLTPGEFRALNRTQPSFVLALLRMFAEETLDYAATVGRLGAMRGRGRFESVLAALAGLVDRGSGTGDVLLPPLRVYELAQMAGISREQASRYLAALALDGTLRREGSRLVVAGGSRVMTREA